MKNSQKREPPCVGDSRYCLFIILAYAHVPWITAKICGVDLADDMGAVFKLGQQFLDGGVFVHFVYHPVKSKWR